MPKIDKKILFLIILVIGGIIFYEFRPELEPLIKDYGSKLSAPGPLRYEGKSERSFLTVNGVLEWTNIQRKNNGYLGQLSLNSKLSLAAQVKLDDMFTRQYFAHYGPGQTSGAGELADKQLYSYITIGENLALGNFKDDQELVQAWMDSPGHKANILNEKFEEIGIAVGRGLFENKQTWIAVQIFARPSSSCPSVDLSLESRINQNQIRLNQMKSELESKRKRNIINEYNQLVSSYNALVQETKALVESYNSQVKTYNNCIQN